MRRTVVRRPRRPRRLLPSYIPHQEPNVLVHNFFHITADGGRRHHHLVEQPAARKRRTLGIVCVSCALHLRVHLIQQCSLSGIIETNDDDLVLAVREEPRPDGRKQHSLSEVR